MTTILSNLSPGMVKSQHSEYENQYKELLRSIGWIGTNAGILELRGPDAPDFLQRMSTNDIKELRPLQSAVTVLTTDKAKIIDLTTIVRLEKELLLITGGGNQIRVKEWLERFIIMDDVQVIDVTDYYEVFSAIGAQVASTIASHLSIDSLALKSLETGEVRSSSDYIVLRNPMWTMVPAFTVLRRRTGDTYGPLGAQFDISQIDPYVYEVLRIEQGVPVWGRELTEHVNPLEAGLSKYVSSSKGCYIGQEVIARLETYGKLQKKLSGFAFQEGTSVWPSQGKLFHDSKEIGCITSTCRSLEMDKWIALGYCSTKTSASKLDYVSEEGNTRNTVVRVELPFLSQ